MGAFSFLEALQNEVGPRRAGTCGEQRALEWLEDRCREQGWYPERQPFRYIGSQVYRRAVNLLLIAAFLGAFFLPRWAGLLLIALVFSFVLGWRVRLELRLARTAGENLLAGLNRPLSAYTADAPRPPALIFCAHYDTARCVPRWLHGMTDVFRIAGPLAMLAFILYALLELVHLGSQLLAHLAPQAEPAARTIDSVAEWGGWVTVVLVAPLFLFMLLSTLASLGRRQDSPGADDNGSGIAVLLELGRRLREAPPPGVEVFLAFWGAEESGLFGSRQFVKHSGSAFSPERTALVNVDCVGVGEYLSVYAGQGVFRRRGTDPASMAQLEAICREQGVPTLRVWESIISGGSSDHAEWVDRGYRKTASLIRENYRRPSLPARVLGALLRIPYVNQMELKHIHSAKDTVEVIVPERLEDIAVVVEQYGRQMAAELAR